MTPKRIKGPEKPERGPCDPGIIEEPVEMPDEKPVIAPNEAPVEVPNWPVKEPTKVS